VLFLLLVSFALFLAWQEEDEEKDAK